MCRAKSYEDDHSTGKVQIIGGDNMHALKGRNVLIVEVSGGIGLGLGLETEGWSLGLG